MAGSSIARRCHVDLAGISFCIGNKFRNCFGGYRWMKHHQVGHADNTRDWYDVAEKIEIKFLVERCVDRVSWSDQQQVVAICERAHRHLGTNIAASARPVFNDEWLAKLL